MDIHLNSEPVKYGILALTFPFWMPFAKALWSELNSSLRDEGGVFGDVPTAAELRAIESQQGRFRSGMVSVTWAEHERLEAGGSPAATAAGAPAPAPARKRGFGSR